MPFGSFNKNPRDRNFTVAGIFFMPALHIILNAVKFYDSEIRDALLFPST